MAGYGLTKIPNAKRGTKMQRGHYDKVHFERTIWDRMATCGSVQESQNFEI